MAEEVTRLPQLFNKGDQVVDLEPVKPLRVPVTLAQVKADAKLKQMALVRQSRLSVMPVEKTQARRILELGETKLRGVT